MDPQAALKRDSVHDAPKESSRRTTAPVERAAGARASKARERILAVCAVVILLFAPSDVYTLGFFAKGPLLIRIEWSVSIFVTILALRRAEPHGARVILTALVMLSSALYGALAMLTGGLMSPLFHWILALPIVMALVLPDLPGAVVGCGFVVAL
jgi:hypothetical protein